jgi:hypothetical protein
MARCHPRINGSRKLDQLLNPPQEVFRDPVVASDGQTYGAAHHEGGWRPDASAWSPHAQGCPASHHPSSITIHPPIHPPTHPPNPPTPPPERAAILSWMTKSDSSPVNGQPLVRGALLPNKLVKAMVDELAPPPLNA